MKHTLQWKFIGIMFVSLFCGVITMAITEYLVFAKLQGMTAEQAEQIVANDSYIFNSIFLVITIAVFFLLSRKIIKRIEVMSHNVEQIAAGKLLGLEPDYKGDELGNLSRSINGMAEKIAHSLEKERQMVCNVAHDLRTPVTSIQGYARLLEKSLELSEKNLKYVSIIQNKSEHLSEQIEELLEYSILEFEEKEYKFEVLSLRRIIEQVLIEFVPMLEQQQMKFSIQGNKNELLFNCNQLLMVRLFENLFTNCVRYGNKGGRIIIELSEDIHTLKVSISNYGKTLTEEEIEHLFEAFYQGKDAKNYETKSKGLGLAIAQKVVLIHQGNIKVYNESTTKKTTFSIEFHK